MTEQQRAQAQVNEYDPHHRLLDLSSYQHPSAAPYSMAAEMTDTPPHADAPRLIAAGPGGKYHEYFYLFLTPAANHFLLRTARHVGQPHVVEALDYDNALLWFKMLPIMYYQGDQAFPAGFGDDDDDLGEAEAISPVKDGAL